MPEDNSWDSCGGRRETAPSYSSLTHSISLAGSSTWQMQLRGGESLYQALYKGALQNIIYWPVSSLERLLPAGKSSIRTENINALKRNQQETLNLKGTLGQRFEGKQLRESNKEVIR